ncbi:MAG: YncE family protein [Nitrosopumilus sp.]
MQIKIILSVLVLFSLVFLVPSDAFAEITDATVTFVESHELTGSGGTPRYFDFNEDGTRLIIVEGATDFIEQYTLSTGYDLTTLSYAGNGQRFNSNSGGTGDGQPRGIEFNGDGTKMFVVGNAADEINQYSLSTGFNVKTASFAQKIDITNTVGTGPHGMEFSGDGTKIFLNNRGQSVLEFHIDAFDIKPLGSVVRTIDISDHLTKSLRGMEFGDDGNKFYVIEADCASACFDVAKVHEFTLGIAYDVDSFSYEGEFDVLEWEQDAQGLGFSPDGTSMYVLGTNRGDGNHRWNGTGEFIREFELSCPWQLTGTCGEEEVKKSDECYDCEAPKLAKVEVNITSNTSDEIINENSPQISETRDYVWTFDQKTPYPMFDDYKTPIIADPGDQVEIVLELTDNRTLERIADSGTYTNFLHKPNDMNNFYANNFDEYGKVSTTFYEWHNTGDDLFYDYDQTVEWSKADVVIEESGELDNRVCCNQDDLTGTFTISFNMKFLQPMQTTDVWVQGTDRSGNFFKVSLPLTLKVAGNEPLVFESKVNQKVLGFYDESMLNDVVSDWTGSTQDVSELAILLGIADEQLPPWVANLALWVSEDKLTIGDMIVSIEHLINN